MSVAAPHAGPKRQIYVSTSKSSTVLIIANAGDKIDALCEAIARALGEVYPGRAPLKRPLRLRKKVADRFNPAEPLLVDLPHSLLVGDVLADGDHVTIGEAAKAFPGKKPKPAGAGPAVASAAGAAAPKPGAAGAAKLGVATPMKAAAAAASDEDDSSSDSISSDTSVEPAAVAAAASVRKSGQKACASCGLETGPRKRVCDACNVRQRQQSGAHERARARARASVCVCVCARARARVCVCAYFDAVLAGRARRRPSRSRRPPRRGSPPRPQPRRPRRRPRSRRRRRAGS